MRSDQGALNNVDMKTARGLNNKESEGYILKFLKDLRTVELHSKGGLYIGNSIAFSVDANDYGKRLKRLLKGLYTKSPKKSLPRITSSQHDFISNGMI